MEITQLSEEEQQAITAPPVAQGPSKDDLVKQLEADYLVAQRDGNTELMAELDERHSRVSAATDNAQALSEYEYRASTEVVEPVLEDQ